MTSQLRLLDPADADWRLDERTKAIGRVGIARARAALQAARVPGLEAPEHAETAAHVQTHVHAA